MAGAEVIELLLRGIAIGALAATAVGLWRGGHGQPARIAGVLLALGVAAYALQSSPAAHDAIRPIAPIVHFLALGGGGLFWLFVVTVFGDRQLTVWTLAPFLLLTALGLVGWLTPPPTDGPIWVVHNLIEGGLAAHALLVVARSWRGDLVEARRRLRGPFLAVVTLFVLVLTSLEIGEVFGVSAAWYPLAGAAALAFFCTLGAMVFLHADAALFGAVKDAEAREGDTLDAGERHLLDRLTAAMEREEAWRREGLTIGALAEAVGAPEHQLRRLINDRLGHRNFAAFVNAHRIEAAKAALTDPARARQSVSAIAFELGFGSLGPFNRAFKDATGQTPSEWRRQSLSVASPIPENPG
ncbi:MAG TPA: helix-turn-helix domain-containing protein [Vitreimonas sp.]|uniref:AraC family transcriptional regulator n=1 Tax=Vitreimonas sp. TaxID=3069702 RepID=UPI002D755C53|nr:helix-turn-helix domain-containing protein [Vitreimonas sp.]HYD89673.1 helix-turn-helix domain-containing protein [Vitreimonas sp.]